MKKNELRFGTGGLPFTTPKKRGVKGGIERLHELGLQHLEMEFVQNVFVKPEIAPEIKKVAEQNDITLTVHGSYYVNLASSDKPKWHAGISRIASAAHVGELMGAKSVTYHSGFTQGQEIQEVEERVIEGTFQIIEEAKAKGSQSIKISPELTGKPSQYGSVEELILINKRLRERGMEGRVSLCIDFAHNYARSGGKYNSYAEVMAVLDLLNKELGSEILDGLHIHMSAIEFGDKGEKNHLLYLSDLEEYRNYGVWVDGIEPFFEELDAKRLNKNNFAWEEVLRALKDSNVGGYVVCESPILELDALVMQKFYRNL